MIKFIISKYNKHKNGTPKPVFWKNDTLFPIILVTFATYVAWFATYVTRLCAFWTISGQMPPLITVVTGLSCRWTSTIWAATRDMPGFVTIVTRRLVGALWAILSEVSLPVTSVASFRFFFAFTCEMPESVAFVALFSPPVEAVASTAVSTAWLRTFAGKVPWSAAFITHSGTHIYLSCV